MKSSDQPFDFKTRLKSFSYAFSGLKFLIQTQHNTWIHLLAIGMVVCCGSLLNVSLTEWCFLIFAIGFVLVTEAVNTAIECLTDLVSPDYHELAKITKDVSAGAVLLAAISAMLVGMIIFLPRIWQISKGALLIQL